MLELGGRMGRKSESNSALGSWCVEFVWRPPLHYRATMHEDTWPDSIRTEAQIGASARKRTNAPISWMHMLLITAMNVVRTSAVNAR